MLQTLSRKSCSIELYALVTLLLLSRNLTRQARLVTVFSLAAVTVKTVLKLSSEYFKINNLIDCDIISIDSQNPISARTRFRHNYSYKIYRTPQDSISTRTLWWSNGWGVEGPSNGHHDHLTWGFVKFERTHQPTKCHVLSGFDHQKTYTHPIF